MSRDLRFHLAWGTAALALFFGGFVVHAVALSDRWLAVREALALKPLVPSGGGMLQFFLADVLRAFVLVGIVAFFTPGSRSRARAAFGSGLALWTIMSVIPRLGEAPIGIFPVDFLFLWALLEAPACFVAAGLVVALLPVAAAPAPAPREELVAAR